jgi:alpha-1,6-mannosyltransferase
MTRSPRGHRGWLYLLSLAGLSLTGYIALQLWFPLAPYANSYPSPDVRSLAPSLANALAYAGLLCALFLLYWLAYRLVQRMEPGKSLVLLVFLSAAAFCLPLLSAFPINATDVYRYFIRGRISSVHSENPFLVPVAEIDDEPYARLAGEWATETSPYGPLWELTAAAVASVTPDDLLAGLLSFKVMAALAFLAGGLLIWWTLRETSPVRRTALALLWLWNPALLLIFAMDGHNDSLMLAWLLLGWLLISRGRIQLGMIVALLAPLTKPIALLALPYFFLDGWGQLPDRRTRIRFLLASAGGGLLLAWLAFLPFGSPLDLARRLLGEASSGGGFSPLAWFILEARQAGLTMPARPVTRIFSGLFVLLAIGLLWLTWRGRPALRATADVFAGYILQAFRFRIWYAAWPFAWLVLDSGQTGEADASARGRLAAGTTFLLTTQLSVLIYGQIRTELLGRSQLRAHRAGIAFTFLLPLVVGLLVATLQARSLARQSEG